MNDLQTVFEIPRTSESTDFTLIIFGFVALVIGVCGIKLKNKKLWPSWIAPPWMAIFLGVVFIIVGWYLLSRPKGDPNRLFYAYKKGQHQIVEGRVHVLHEQPAGGHSEGDVISINGKQFEINFFKDTPAYKNTIAHGGVLREGVHARIYYCGNDIIRIDTEKIYRQDPQSKGNDENQK